MNLLSEITTLLDGLNVPFETGYYSGKAPDEYVVIVPLSDTLENFADNLPHNEVQSARLSIFSKNNYIKLRNRLTKALLDADFTITDRRYIGFEFDTSFHHYSVDALKLYKIEKGE